MQNASNEEQDDRSIYMQLLQVDGIPLKTINRALSDVGCTRFITFLDLPTDKWELFQDRMDVAYTALTSKENLLFSPYDPQTDWKDIPRNPGDFAYNAGEDNDIRNAERKEWLKRVIDTGITFQQIRTTIEETCGEFIPVDRLVETEFREVAERVILLMQKLPGTIVPRDKPKTTKQVKNLRKFNFDE
jgi:hypothetical protein